MNPFQSLRNYEEFIYTIVQRHPIILRSTLTVVRRGALLATVNGELLFPSLYRLVLRERLNLEHGRVRIDFYGYEVWCSSEKLFWYDSQSHPHVPELQSTHPHHKHVPPNIKQNRQPAPGFSFRQPNLPRLIEEITNLLSMESHE